MARVPSLGLVTEAFAHQSLVEVMEWLQGTSPSITDLEIGSGGYAPTTHCDLETLLRDASAREQWHDGITSRGFRVGAFNVWGNPLHPDSAIATKHDQDLRETIRLAAMLGVDRVVALAGCPPGHAGDRTPHFAGGGWLPYLEEIHAEQWSQFVEPYWASVADFAAAEHPRLRICLELHPGTAVYNVETFERVAALGDSIAANIDPSHFFWMHMDPIAVVEAVGDRACHCHAKDVAFDERNLALNGLLDRRWPRPPEQMPWNFTVPGRGRDAAWWQRFLRKLVEVGRINTISIEHEDPFVPPAKGVPEAAALLEGALATA
ncbi:MAG TPA: sugar phosphate isomerase/epimerase [Candidatus Dormibacteraeota bacterium]|nr:sugar phosphate isomerase/epimerase [Candidatus Dormibacteraeota bacterium]